MTTPPVCDYTDSDYQTSFWDNGGRAYEDAVEAVALKRLLPKQGELLLEIGAGAGRNTPRYKGFKKVILVDYSATQLEQAQERLGVSDRYKYVAANAYHLPFMNGLFDCATMIRTLHHMADAPLALQQVANILKSNGVFILEYANKKNLKAILRYALKRQSWNPFSQEPVEFADLNFDFHPASIRELLKSCGFNIDNQLTVSHFRIGMLKKIIPLKVLVALDSVCQYTGKLWQFTPSVFMKASLVKQDSEADESIGLFRCPACNHGPLPDTPPEIKCPSCGHIWKVKNGIFDFRIDH